MSEKVVAPYGKLSLFFIKVHTTNTPTFSLIPALTSGTHC